MRYIYKFLALFTFIALTSTSFASKQAIQCRVDLDRPVLPAGVEQTAVIKVSLDAPDVPQQTERPAVNLTLVVDRSGSMSGSKMDKAKEAAVEGLRRLMQRDMFSLVIYDHEVETLVPAQSASYTEWIESKIHGIRSRGNTALFGAVSQGAAENRKNANGAYVNRIILLSDGLANVGPSSPSDLARLGAALMKEGISVTTIGIGTDFNEDLMVQLAEKSDGNHYFVESSADLPRIFASELGDVLSVVARKVIIEVECPKDVVPVRIIGRDGQIVDGKAQIQMNQLYGGQQKYALLEVKVPAHKANAARDLAVARVKYENALSGKDERAEANANVRFSEEKKDVEAAENIAVQTAVIQNRAAEVRDQALDMYNAGEPQKAASWMVTNMAIMKGLYSAPETKEVAELQDMEEEADAYENSDVTPEMKKRVRSSSYETRVQQ